MTQANKDSERQNKVFCIYFVTQQILDSPSRDGFETRLYCANCKKIKTN